MDLISFLLRWSSHSFGW